MGRHHADAALQELERQYARSHNGRPMPDEVRAVVRSGYERADLVGRTIGIAVTAVGFAAAMLTFHRLRR